MFISPVVGWNQVHSLNDKRNIFTNAVHLTWTQHVFLLSGCTTTGRIVARIQSRPMSFQEHEGNLMLSNALGLAVNHEMITINENNKNKLYLL